MTKNNKHSFCFDTFSLCKNDSSIVLQQKNEICIFFLKLMHLENLIRISIIDYLFNLKAGLIQV